MAARLKYSLPKGRLRLMARVWSTLRVNHYSPKTQKSYLSWIRQFILFTNKRHPKDMGEVEINQFLLDLAVKRNVSASTQSQALGAIVFPYENVLHKRISSLGPIVFGQKAKKVPAIVW